MKRLKMAVLIAALAAAPTSFAAGLPLLGGASSSNQVGAILGGLTTLGGGVLKVPPGTVSQILTTDLVPAFQDLGGGGLNALATLPGLGALGGKTASGNTLIGIQQIPGVGSNAATVLQELPTLAPMVVQSVVPSAIGTLARAPTLLQLPH